MQLLDRCKLLALRWMWLIVIGTIFCATITFVVSKSLPMNYKATALLIIDMNPSSSSSDNINASELAAPTFVGLITTPTVLQSVITRHPGLSTHQLDSMITVQHQSNTQ